MKTVGIEFSALSLPKPSTASDSSKKQIDDLNPDDQKSFRYFAQQLSPSSKALSLMTIYLAAKRLENSALDIGVKNGSGIIANRVDSFLMDKDGQPKERITTDFEKIVIQTRSLFEMSMRALDSERGFAVNTEKQQARLLLNLGNLLVNDKLKPVTKGLEAIVDLMRAKANTLAPVIADLDQALAGQLVSLAKTDFGIEKPQPTVKKKVAESDIHPDLLNDDPVKALDARFTDFYKQVQGFKSEDRLYNQDLLSAIAKI